MSEKNTVILLSIANLLLATFSKAMETSDLEDKGTLKLEKLVHFKKKLLNTGSRLGGGYALYNYDGRLGTSNWGGVCETGSSQSPIDFTPDVTYEAVSSKLRFYGVHQVPICTNISNSGHSVKLKLDTPEPIYVTGGVLGDELYEFQQAHFHWGPNMSEGSEHSIMSRRFPFEAHFVFYRTGYDDPTEGGMAVMAVMYELSFKDSFVLDPVVKNIGKIIKYPGFVERGGGVELRDYLPRDLNSYLYYTGSLTTPPCMEGVTWIVFTDRQHISPRQVTQFKKMRDALGLEVKWNIRDTQALNGRQVFLVNS